MLKNITVKLNRISYKQRVAIVAIATLASIIGLLAGCSASDSWDEDVYLRTLYVYDGANWNQITTNGGGGGGVPAGADTNVQYNEAGAFGGEANFTYDYNTNALYVSGDITNDNDIWCGNDLNIANDLDVTDDTAIGGDLDVTGTINGINILAHAVRHAVGGADAIFPADPGADKYLMWDDSASVLSWEDAGGGSVGGLYGVNAQLLAGNKTLTSGVDEIYQLLDGNNSDRTVTLDTASASAGDRFIIKNTSDRTDQRYLSLLQGATEFQRLWPGNVANCIFDGTNWYDIAPGAGYLADSSSKACTGVGYNARADNYGAAFGSDAIGGYYGASVGYNSDGYYYGVALGYNAEGKYNGVGIGYRTDTNNNYYSTAIGYYSETERYGEFARNIGSDSDQENNITQGGFEGQIAGGAGATEIYCAGQAGQRFTIRASSALSFNIQVVARDNTADEVARYSFEGLIKRDGAGNTTLVWSSGGADYEDDAAWDCVISADDANEALIITCTGDAANTTQWAAVMDGVETHW